MRDVSIGRLTLELSHRSEGDARRLAELVTEGLAAATIGGGNYGYVASLSVALHALPGEGVERLGERVVADMLRQIEKGYGL
jgi:hypothetical protein